MVELECVQFDEITCPNLVPQWLIMCDFIIRPIYVSHNDMPEENNEYLKPAAVCDHAHQTD